MLLIYVTCEIKVEPMLEIIRHVDRGWQQCACKWFTSQMY